jgi:uncharacterized protein with HEPN domain
MSKKSETQYIDDMVRYARRAAARVRGLSRQEFLTTVEHQEKVAYNLMIVGEAASKISEQTRATYPSIPWAQITGMRNQIVHGYSETEQATLWQTVTEDIPLLIAALEAPPNK